MSRQISLYKHKENLKTTCHLTVWIESLLLLFYILFYVFVSFMMIEYPEDDLSPTEMLYFIAATIILVAVWILIFRYYAYDLILAMEIQGDVILLHSMLRSYCVALNEDVILKEGITGENVIIIFKSKAGKKKKKYFKKYIMSDFKKIENLDVNILSDILELER